MAFVASACALVPDTNAIGKSLFPSISVVTDNATYMCQCLVYRRRFVVVTSVVSQ